MQFFHQGCLHKHNAEKIFISTYVFYIEYKTLVFSRPVASWSNRLSAIIFLPILRSQSVEN